MLLAKPDASEEECIDALKAANAWDFINEKMVDGLDTQVGGVAGSLSGGQKQRIAIARAFIKKPRIILLDEATSALDSMNEKIVNESIDAYRKAAGNVTVLVIAHRLSSIRNSDKIIVIKNGVLSEVGNHDELLQSYPDGIYAGFVSKQSSAQDGGAAQENTGTKSKDGFTTSD